MPSARVVAITKPLVSECETASDFVAYSARVSNPGNQANKETAPRLLDYLKRHKHWSPFEMASATLEITTTRDISHQIIRHRSFSYQEFSQRYAEVEAIPAFREARMQDAKNRQNSLQCDDYGLAGDWMGCQAVVWNRAVDAYSKAIRNGVAKEVARAVLPEGLTPTTLYMHGTFRSWLHYIEIRTDPSTQKEHREVADLCRAALAEHEEIFR